MFYNLLANPTLFFVLQTEKDNAGKDFFNMLDNDCDGLVTFKEYITFVAALSCLITS